MKPSNDTVAGLDLTRAELVDLCDRMRDKARREHDPGAAVDEPGVSRRSQIETLRPPGSAEMIPTAALIKNRGRFVHIRCPYCNGVHEHGAIEGRFVAGTVHRRAPGCGMQRTAAERAAGYRFTIPGSRETNQGRNP